MSEMYKKVCSKISEQQKALEKGPAYFVGEHIKSILKNAPEGASEIVLADLELETMSIEECEKLIKKYADEHKEGSMAFVPPDVAENIICDFYKIGTILGKTKIPNDCEFENNEENTDVSKIPNGCEFGLNTGKTGDFLNLEDYI